MTTTPTGDRPRLRWRADVIAGVTVAAYVDDVKGPLDEGEVERARRWGEDLAREVLSSSRPAAGR